MCLNSYVTRSSMKELDALLRRDPAIHTEFSFLLFLSNLHRKQLETMAGIRFGLIADIQFAFAPNRTAPGKPRYYQDSLRHLSDAVSDWNRENILFIVQLGDIIDGVNVQYSTSKQALDNVLAEFEKADCEVIHILGNHEPCNLSRQELMSTALFSGFKKHNENKRKQTVQDLNDGAFYYTFIVKDFPGFRFVALDTFDESLLGRDESSPEYRNAMSIIRKYNDNEDVFAYPNGKSGLAARFIGDGGGVGKAQMEWLDKVLTEADSQCEKVLLFSHAPLHPKCVTLPEDVPWNCEEVLEILWRHPCVKVSLSGHVHENIYHYDDHGVQHYALNAVLEADPSSNAYATVYLYEDRLKVVGKGQVDSHVFVFQ